MCRAGRGGREGRGGGSGPVEEGRHSSLNTFQLASATSSDLVRGSDWVFHTSGQRRLQPHTLNPKPVTPNPQHQTLHTKTNQSPRPAKLQSLHAQHRRRRCFVRHLAALDPVSGLGSRVYSCKGFEGSCKGLRVHESRAVRGSQVALVRRGFRHLAEVGSLA